MDRREFIAASSAALLSLIATRNALAQFDGGNAMPEAFTQAGLDHLHEVVKATAIDSGMAPGAVILVAKGDEVHVDIIGNTAFEDGKAMARDTIFRIASLTKPVTAAAVMILVEDGKLSLDEPIDRLLPELANRRVLTAMDAPLDSTVPAERPILVRDVMNFTFGFGINFDPNLPIQQEIDRLQLVNGPPVPQTPHDPDEWIKRFGTLPLMHQPGATFQYNTGSLILGVLVARASGQSFGDFLKARIFDPLGMKDTAFFVPEERRDRFTSAYGADFETFKPILDDAPDGQWSYAPPFPSGAGGLCSTVDDYLAFARMMMNRGEYNGVRILSEASVAEMTKDQLTPEQKAGAGLWPQQFDTHGWGYGVYVATAADDITPTPGRYGWDGGYGTSWSNDPATGLIGILMTQSSGYYVASNGFHDFWAAAFSALSP